MADSRDVENEKETAPRTTIGMPGNIPFQLELIPKPTQDPNDPLVSFFSTLSLCYNSE